MFTYEIQIDGLLAILSTLPNIHRIEWGGEETIDPRYNHFHLFHLVATQLCSISSPCQIIVVRLSPASWERSEHAKDHCKLIDEVLTGDNFPSLRHVQLYEKIPFDYFPILHSRGLLEQ